jgi:hypothetical protein
LIDMDKNVQKVESGGVDQDVRWRGGEAAPTNRQPVVVSEDYQYFKEIFAHLKELAGWPGLRLALAVDTRDAVGEVDADTVAIVTSDENCQLPVNVRDAGLILKCHGVEPYPMPASPVLPAALVERLRVARERRRWRADAARLGPAGVAGLLAKTELVPMGYCKQLDLPLVPFAERRRVFSFRGSVDNYRAGLLSRHAVTNYPKRVARQRFLAALREVAREAPADACDLRITTDFDDSLKDAGRDYSTALMDSRFCLCPRGTRLETFRIFEGLRYGCITVTEALPDRWYLRGAPLLSVGDWRELPGLMRRLLADPERMAELHHRSLAWWRDMISPLAIARRVLPRLERGGPARHAAVGSAGGLG